MSIAGRRVLVVGANGQLGTDLCAVAAARGCAVTGLTHDDLEVTDRDAVLATLEQALPQTVVHTAAFHNVDRCEEEPGRAFEVNAVGTRNLALGARECGAELIHLSTDYVFDGEKGEAYVEADAAHPVNVYGATKLTAEALAAAELVPCLAVRTSALYGEAPCRAKQGLNFVQLMLKLGAERGEVKVVEDQFVSPTSTRALAAQIVALFGQERRGVVHATSQGACSWYEFARRIFEMAGRGVRVAPVPSSEFPAKTRRPSYSILDNAQLRAWGVDLMPEWEASLQAYLPKVA
jgi:dTDP-4-dehydrorhamnose reductase